MHQKKGICPCILTSSWKKKRWSRWPRFFQSPQLCCYWALQLLRCSLEHWCCSCLEQCCWWSEWAFSHWVWRCPWSLWERRGNWHWCISGTGRIASPVWDPSAYPVVGVLWCDFALNIFAPANFVPVSFDSGGVTTVPFIMALGLGIALSKDDKNSSSDSFGLIALCSIGPILAVLLLGILYRPAEAGTAMNGSSVKQAKIVRNSADDFL